MGSSLTPDHRALADAWWAEQALDSGGSEAWYRLQALAQSDPHAAWGILGALVERLGDVTGAPAPFTREDNMRARVASVLGNILEAHGAAFARRASEAAEAQPMFRELLGRLTLPDDAVDRPALEQLRVASGGRLRVAPAPGSELAKVACAVADEFRAGTLTGVRPHEQHPVPLLAAEIERRLPGRSREDYAVAAERGLHWSR